ncbi:MAG: arylsulfatase [Lysobacterales bacterium]
MKAPLPLFGLLCTTLVACQSEQKPILTSSFEAQAERPNILLIVADDMGWSDLGSFGGEIATPNLDALAFAGVRLTNFHTATMCSPSRAMLLTGVDAHKAGFGNMLEELAPNQKGQPGYEAQLTNNVVTVATLLKDAGYRTYLTGKWHLGNQAESLPGRRGFQRSFVLGSGGASHFSDMKPAYAPTPDAKAAYLKDDQPLTTLPDSFGYSSQFYADELTRYLKEEEASGQPFFAMLSFTAPHWPLQAPDRALNKYRGKYSMGYDTVLDERLQTMKQLGLIDAGSQAAVRPPKGKPWDSLSDAERRVEARNMEVYAAMIDEMDVHTGKVIDYLRANGQLDNTIVIFLSDNGAEGHDLDETWPGDMFPKIRAVIDNSFDFSYDAMGKIGSYVLYGPNWARAGSVTGRLHKAFPTDGGTRAAAFIHYPKALGDGLISDAVTSIKDITPTLLELADVSHPDTEYQGRSIEPITGVSLVPLLNQQNIPTRALGHELMGKRSLRLGDWKLIHLPPPYGTNAWQLFNLASDPGELEDLAQRRPQKFAELKALWDQHAKANGIIVPDWVSGY